MSLNSDQYGALACDLHLRTTDTEDDADVEETALGVHPHVCDQCGRTPIQGTRYNCQTCSNFDLCRECRRTRVHDASHPLTAVAPPAYIAPPSDGRATMILRSELVQLATRENRDLPMVIGRFGREFAYAARWQGRLVALKYTTADAESVKSCTMETASSSFVLTLTAWCVESRSDHPNERVEVFELLARRGGLDAALKYPMEVAWETQRAWASELQTSLALTIAELKSHDRASPAPAVLTTPLRLTSSPSSASSTTPHISASDITFVSSPPSLGLGRHGSVRLARMRGQEGFVAVKRLERQDAHDIVIHASLASNLHLAVIGVCHQPNGAALLVMEHAANGDLHTYLKQQGGAASIAWPMRLKWARQLATAVKSALDSHGVHVDNLRSTKCLLDANLDIKLATHTIDGARRSDESDVDTPLPSRWLAPEAVRSAAASRGWMSRLVRKVVASERTSSGAAAAAAVWSLGLILRELVTGKLPFASWRDEDVEALVPTLNAKDIERSFRAPDDCPQRLAEVISKCVSFDASSRPSVDEVTRAVHTIDPSHFLTVASAVRDATTLRIRQWALQRVAERGRTEPCKFRLDATIAAFLDQQPTRPASPSAVHKLPGAGMRASSPVAKKKLAQRKSFDNFDDVFADDHASKSKQLKRSLLDNEDRFDFA